MFKSCLCLNLGILSLTFFSAPLAIAQDTDWFDVDSMIAQFYETNGADFREITAQVLANPLTSPKARQSIQEYNRHIYSFEYPSDGLKIKAFISFSKTDPTPHPLVILLRGGNRNFGLIFPGDEIVNYKNYTVISSAMRGGISQGKDEFGGADVDDVSNLMRFLPTIEKQFGISHDTHHLFMIGPSRGALEMFLTLGRNPDLQKQVDKIVSLSGILDISQLIQDRPLDMKQMFIEDYGLKQGSEAAWEKRRDPLLTAGKLRKNLPILIIQGTSDDRVSLKEGYHMMDALRQAGHQPTYWEVPGGNHTVRNDPSLTQKIYQWLESDDPIPSN